MCAGQPGGKAGKENSASPRADNKIRPFCRNGAQGLCQIMRGRPQHLQWLAQPGLAQRHMVNKIGAMVARDAAAQCSLFRHKKMVMRAPHGF